MDFSSTASSLRRPRVTLAIVTAAAAVSVVVYLFQQSRSSPSTSSSHAQGLHRSNAVRRHRRSHGEGHDGERRNSNVSTASSAQSHGDENADLNNLRAQIDGETVADEHEQAMEEQWWDDPAQRPPQRAGQNIVSLLFRVSEDNARRNAYVHRGCACNACGIVPIRGVRYRCANCADFDLCETCESQGLHIKTHIFYKVKVPAPPFGPRQMQPIWYPGDPDTCLRSLPRGLMAKLSRETGFERTELEAFWEQWTFMADTEWREDPDDLYVAMDRKTFERCLVPSGGSRHTAPNLIHDRMFSFYDTNNDDLIGFSEFLHGLSYRKRKDKLRKIYDGYDIDRDGLVSRRDFLRVFRAYYVLYKQMHKDILEGLDDQVMSSSESNQLIASRQPLSSLFGREGRVPQADQVPRTEGKIFHSNGDVLVSHGMDGAVAEDRPDISNREEILTSLFSHDTEPFHENAGAAAGSSRPDARFLDALLDPPSSLQEIPALLQGTRPNLNDITPGESRPEGLGESEESASSEVGDETHSPNENAGQVHGTSRAQVPGEPNGEERRASDVRPRPARVPSERSNHRMPAENGQHPQHQAFSFSSHGAGMSRSARVAARRRLYDRWARRQFYLDEEEGAAPPSGWTPEKEVLMGTNGASANSKSADAAHVSPRSRSSSKVRFAEDIDDYEIRSNPSTSSRSVPERWGGIDIPDAEKDAGKEILYQVTQQAFNELLDILFKRKEDLAIRCAESKELREMYRSQWESIDLKEEDKRLAAEIEADSPFLDDIEEDKPVVEDKPVQEQSLEELLRTSGYTIEEMTEKHKAEPQEPDTDDHKDPAEEDLPDVPSEVEPKAIEYRDPTMPQFRPNSLADLTKPFSVVVPVSADSETSGEDKTPKQKKSARGKAKAGKNRREMPRSVLVEFKRLDTAEQEASARGGWGRLSYEEFEEIYKREESHANRLDYLGSWIDFCIP